MAAAGVVVYRVHEGVPQALGLIALEDIQEKNKGVYDIPKGQIDAGEDAHEAACRECREECGINPTLLKSDYFKTGNITVWIYETYQTPQIIKNPVHGHYEHQGYKWCSLEELYNNCLDYLRPHVKWAIQKIANEHKVELI